MTGMALFLVMLFFAVLGIAYVKGYDFVKSRSPEFLAHFYLIMAVVRMLLVATVAALCVFLAPDRANAIFAAITILIMYALMMVVTLSIRH